MWCVIVVLALVPSILAAGRGESCVNQNGKEGICTILSSCNAAVDSVAATEDSNSPVTEIVCEDDTEALVCCQTPEDTPAQSNEANIASFGLSPNGTLEITLVIPDKTGTAGADDDVPSTSELVDAIFTSSPIEPKQQTPEASEPTVQQSTEASAPDVLPLASNDTNDTPVVPEIFTEFPGQSPPPTFDPFRLGAGSQNPDQPLDSSPNPNTNEEAVPQILGSFPPQTNEESNPSDSQFSGSVPSQTNEGSNPPDSQFPDSFPSQTNEGSNPPDSQFPGSFPSQTNEGSNPPDSQFPDSFPSQTNEGSNPPDSQFPGSFPSQTNEGSNPPDSQFPGSFPSQTNEGSNPPDSQFPGSFPPQTNEESNPENSLPDSNEGSSPSPLPGSFPGGVSSESPEIVTESPEHHPSVPMHELLPDRKTCGFQYERKRMTWPVSTIDEFPWVALLNYENERGEKAGFKCVGTLITKNFVVSAAQCLDDSGSYKLRNVRLGEWSIKNVQDCTYDHMNKECADDVVDIDVAYKLPHPQYDPLTGANNIGLARLERHVEFSDFIRPICLPVEHLEPPTPDVYFSTSGWGASKNGIQMDTKSKYFLKVLSPEKCSKVSYKRVLEDHLCTGTVASLNLCFMDSGGPIMLCNTDNHDQWYLEGVVADGFNCKYKQPGTYTRVTHHVDWIVQTLTEYYTMHS